MMKKSVIFAAVMIAAMAMTVSAQNFNNGPVQMTITGTVGQVQRIQLPGDQAFNLTGDNADGSVELGAMSIFSNVGYSVSVSSTGGYALESGTNNESLPYGIAIDGTEVDESTPIITGARTTGGSDDYILSIVYDQNVADTLAEGSDYADTLEFSIASP